MPSPKYQRRSLFDWQELIAQQAKRGMTIAEFCDATGLSPSAFNNWKRRLRNNPVAEDFPVNKADAPFFLVVHPHSLTQLERCIEKTKL